MAGPWEAFSSASAQGVKPGNLASPIPQGQQQEPVPAAQPVMQKAAMPAQTAPEEAPTLQEAAPGPWAQFAAQPDQAAPEEPTLAKKALSMGAQALQAAAPVLDYPGGLVRTAEAALVSRKLGKQVVTLDDIKNSFKGNAPNSAEYMTRMGVPELGDVDVPLLGKISGRGVAGFISDIVADPLTSLSSLAKEVPYIGKLLQGANGATEAIGKQVYNSSLRKIDAKVAQKAGLESATPVADALSEGVKLPGGQVVGGGAPVGSTAKLADKVNEVSNTIGAVRNELYNKANALGVSIDLQYPFKKAEQFIETMKSDRGLAPQAEAFQELLDRYKAPGKVGLDELSQMRSNMFKTVPKSDWGKVPEMRGFMTQFKSALGADMAEAIQGAGNKAEKGLGDSIGAINNKWGPLLDAKNPLAKMSVQSVPHGDAADKLILSLGGLKDLAVKKAMDMATTSTGRTAIGKAIMKAGQAGVPNRLIINAGRPSPLQPEPEQGQEGQ